MTLVEKGDLVMKNNFLIVAILAILVLALVGCSETVEPPSSETEDVVSDTVEPSEPEAPVTEVEDVSPSDPLYDLTALELAYLMGNGTNLGNTMEAYGRTTVGVNQDPSVYETLWGQPITSPEMFVAMKESGFDSIRIPVAWTNAMNFESGDYTIGEAYLDRVEEIVNYAIDADMFVVVNDHWDGSWWGMFGSATPSTRDAAMDLYVSMWTQIGERFKDHSAKLILESANEELGNRLNDADIAADSGTLSEDECYEMTNLINQTFVDTIRSTGGNNDQRFLLIAGYNTDIRKTVDDRYQMPTDTAENKLLLSVHYYTPWQYCGTSGVARWGTEKHYNTQNDLLAMMTKYTDQGYGIIFGEYAVLTKGDGTLKNNTIDFTRNFLDNCDLYGYVPMLWDTNAFFIRQDLEIFDEELRKLYSDRSLSAQSTMTEEEVTTMARQSMEDHLAIAIENDANNPETGPVLNGDEDAVAWLMFNSNDYANTYSVGDLYDPTSKSDGIIATDLYIDGPGTYTVGLDFRNTAGGFANSTSFTALGISNGELLYPGYIINITEILINGVPYEINKIPYTTADDAVCTRVNLYNGWVNEIPEEARVSNPNMLPYVSPTILDPQKLGNIETYFVTFEYGPVN